MKIGNSAIHFLSFLMGKAQPATQTTFPEQNLLRKYVSGKNCIVEIGVFEGFNTALLACSMDPQGSVYGIDPFYTGMVGISWHKQIARLYISRMKVKSKVCFIETTSEKAVPFIKNVPDFVFIDGDHSWNGIMKDWEIYSALVSKNGIIALHDTSVPEHQPEKGYMDSVRFFNEVIIKDSGFILLDSIDSLNIMQKL